MATYERFNKENEGLIGKIGRGIRNFSVLAGITIGTGLVADYNLKKAEIGPEDFDNANWIEYNNPSGQIWHCYSAENISHNSLNWALYTERIKERNDEKTEGIIELPDLDGDGVVCNQ